MSKRVASAVKILISSALSIAIAFLIVPKFLTIQARALEDQGDRPLVMFATKGGSHEYGLRVRMRVEAAGDLILTFSAHYNKERPVDEEFTREWIEYELAVASAAGTSGRVSCANGEVAPTVEAADLSTGLQYLIFTDSTADENSATNFRGSASPSPTAHPSESLSPAAPSAVPSDGGSGSPASISTVRTHGALATWFEDESAPNQRLVGEGEYGVWVEECRLDKSLIWFGTDADEPQQGARSVLRVPQINFAATSRTTDLQSRLSSLITVERQDGSALVAAYPDVTARDGEWQVGQEVHWMRQQGEDGNFAFTDQPTLFFSNSRATQSESSFLLWAGLGLGVIAALMVRAVMDAVDLFVRESS